MQKLCLLGPVNTNLYDWYSHCQGFAIASFRSQNCMAVTIFQKAGDGLMLYVCALCEPAPENIHYINVSKVKIYFERGETRAGSSP